MNNNDQAISGGVGGAGNGQGTVAPTSGGVTSSTQAGASAGVDPSGTAPGTSGSNIIDSASERTIGNSTNSGSGSKNPIDSTTTETATMEPTPQAVLDYLKKMGMGTAHLELKSILEKQQAERSTTAAKETSEVDSGAAAQQQPKKADESNAANSNDASRKRNEGDAEALKQQLEHDDALARNQRSILSKSTGGGFGYDRDAVAPIVQWGVPDNTAMMRQLAAKKQKTAGGDPKAADSVAPPLADSFGVEEARSYLDAFTAVQLWVLTLPEDEDSLGNSPGLQPQTRDPIAKAQELIRDIQQQREKGAKTKTDLSAASGGDDKDALDSTTDDAASSKEISLSSFVQQIATSSSTEGKAGSLFQLPPSAKPELLAVTFALLVHTYCELLEVGMESTAHVLRDAFQPIYDPMYGKEIRDLFHCTTTEDMMKLNTHNAQHMEALANLKSILVQIASLQLKKEELSHAHINDTATQNVAKAKLQEFDQRINLLQQKYSELSQRASAAFDRMHDLPFLRRARAVRWQLTLSTTTYGLLVGFLNSTSMYPSLLAMSTLLQTKCELHVERRDPLPFTPACVLDDNASSSKNNRRRRGSASSNPKTMVSELDFVNWAAPLPTNKQVQKSTKKALPFPKFHLEEEYESVSEAGRDKLMVEFNRAMLVNGFRRLEALERKRDYQVMASTSFSSESVPVDTGGKAGGGTSDGALTSGGESQPVVANALEPSILLSTLCANSSSAASGKQDSTTTPSSVTPIVNSAGSAGSGNGSSSVTGGAAPMMDAASIWEESGIGLCCAEICPPDGRSVAVGCDDSAVRIWNLMDGMAPDGSMGEPVQVLLGHKNGFPVFSVSWNRDGRSLLSAGGDGSIRLWDTMAQGPFGLLGKSSGTASSSSSKKSASALGTTTPAGSSPAGHVTNAAAKQMLDDATSKLRQANANPDMTVPGLRPEVNTHVSGAALAVYRGHAPSTPIWSVAFAPCGYYFASAGADATARLWTTDRPSPVRLFTGHTANSVNSVVFHPNCNYILTGSEDKTARLWDIQTGRCVRLLNGCSSGISVVEVSPSGQYAAGADLAGFIHLWDLGTGKKVTEFRSKPVAQESSNPLHSKSMVHSLSFSSCANALASGGDDGCVRIWDVRQATLAGLPKPVVDSPFKTFLTRRTLILDLHYTKRNLLLSAGKHVTSLSNKV